MLSSVAGVIGSVGPRELRGRERMPRRPSLGTVSVEVEKVIALSRSRVDGWPLSALSPRMRNFRCDKEDAQDMARKN